MDEVEEASAFRHVQGAGLPIRWVTVNSIVALNLAFFRKAAGLKQEELAERLGWGKTTVSTAERSWNAKRVRSFSVEDLIGIAAALEIPVACPGVPEPILFPRKTWAEPEAYDQAARKLAGLFRDNFAKYSDQAPAEVGEAGPRC